MGKRNDLGQRRTPLVALKSAQKAASLPENKASRASRVTGWADSTREVAVCPHPRNGTRHLQIAHGQPQRARGTMASGRFCGGCRCSCLLRLALTGLLRVDLTFGPTRLLSRSHQCLDCVGTDFLLLQKRSQRFWVNRRGYRSSLPSSSGTVFYISCALL